MEGAEAKTALRVDVTALPAPKVKSQRARGVSDQPEDKLQA